MRSANPISLINETTILSLFISHSALRYIVLVWNTYQNTKIRGKEHGSSFILQAISFPGGGCWLYYIMVYYIYGYIILWLYYIDGIPEKCHTEIKDVP